MGVRGRLDTVPCGDARYDCSLQLRDRLLRRTPQRRPAARCHTSRAHAAVGCGYRCRGIARTRAPDPPRSTALRGFTQTEISRTFGEPDHWSRLRVTKRAQRNRPVSDNVRWKLSGRLDYDAVFDVTNFYPQQVRKDERLNFFARENYIDFAAGDWDFRLGASISCGARSSGSSSPTSSRRRTYRDFLLPEFDILRIPQWADACGVYRQSIPCGAGVDTFSKLRQGPEARRRVLFAASTIPARSCNASRRRNSPRRHAGIELRCFASQRCRLDGTSLRSTTAVSMQSPPSTGHFCQRRSRRCSISRGTSRYISSARR